MPDDKTNPESAPTDESQKPQVIRREHDIGPRVEGLIRDGAQATTGAIRDGAQATKNAVISGKEKMLTVVVSGCGAVAHYLLRTGGKITSATKIIAAAKISAMIEFRNDETSNVSGGEQSLGAIAESAEKFQREKRMANMQSIVGQAIEQMPEQVPDTLVDHDWAARFFDNAKDVSDEKMQKLWAKLLAGEVERSGCVSLRTLDILRNMTQKEAELFARAVNYIFVDANTPALMFRANTGVKALPDISVGELYSLIEAGLVMPYHGQQFGLVTSDPDGYCRLFYTDTKVLRVQVGEFSIPTYKFSISGTQLAKYIKPTVNAEYLQQVADYIHTTTNCAVEVADILAIDQENQQVESSEFQKIAG